MSTGREPPAGRLQPEKLSVEFRGVGPTFPIVGRRYTLTHSDRTADLFLTVGTEYAWERLGPMRDEVLAAWRMVDNKPVLWVQVLVAASETGPVSAGIRNQIFRRELPLALQAIRFGDRALFEISPALDNAPVVVEFRSACPWFSRVEDWGRLADYR